MTQRPQNAPRRAGVTGCARLLGGMLVMLAACGAPPSDPVAGRALSSLELGAVSLLPAVTVAPMPTGGQGAFDRESAPGDGEGVSYSVGTASRGYLVGGEPLPLDHPALKVRPVSLERRAIHGTGALIAALKQAATGLARDYEGSQLFAGDISGLKGGDIPHHASHNSGRDADLAFLLRDAHGAMADGPEMDVIREDGRTEAGKVFDVARNWRLVASLLRNPNVQVQWIFVARHLRKSMLDYGRHVGADGTVMKRARVTLRQPGDSSPHADHFHIRFYCGLEERLRGCVDTGESHPWIDTFGAEVEMEIGRIVALLRGGGVEEKRYVIKRVGQLALRSGASHLEALASDADHTVRIMAIDTMAFLRGERTPPAWAHLTDEDVGE